MVRVAIRCPLFNQMMYLSTCNATNEKRDCENFICKPLRNMVVNRDTIIGANSFDDELFKQLRGKRKRTKSGGTLWKARKNVRNPCE